MPREGGEPTFNTEAPPASFEKRELKSPPREVGEFEPVFTISKSDLLDGQRIYAEGRGFKSFDEIPAIERADFWVRENGWPDNYIEAEKAAKEAGLEPKEVLDFKIRALGARMDALSRSDSDADKKEFRDLDKIGELLRKDLQELE